MVAADAGPMRIQFAGRCGAKIRRSCAAERDRRHRDYEEATKARRGGLRE